MEKSPATTCNNENEIRRKRNDFAKLSHKPTKNFAQKGTPKIRARRIIRCVPCICAIWKRHTQSTEPYKKENRGMKTNNDRPNWTKKKKVSYVMHCIPFAYRCVCRKVKEKCLLREEKKREHEEYQQLQQWKRHEYILFFSVTRYLFFRGACVWHWQQTVQVASHTPKGKNATWDFCCMQNESISKMLPICCRCLCFW